MSDDGNESRDSKNTETEEKSSPTSPSHAVESKSNQIIMSFTKSKVTTHIHSFQNMGGGGFSPKFLKGL